MIDPLSWLPAPPDYKQLLLGVLLAVSIASAPARAADASVPDGVSQRVLTLVNAFREEQGRSKLETDMRLTQAAQSFADFLAATGRFEHDADGATPRARVKQRGYDACATAENIANEYSSRGFTEERLARAFVEGWKQSPAHRENIVDADATQTGVGVSRAKDGGYYAVQLFAEPRTAGRNCSRQRR